MRRLHVATVLFVLVGLLAPATSHAQQSVNFYVGGLVTPDWHEREFTDVVANNLSGGEYGLAFDIHEFNGITAGGEYLVGLSNFLDAGLGVGFYSQRVPSVYANKVNSDGSEIRQDISLRMVPFTATVRLLPFGRSNGFEPYIGAGVAIINWRYKEAGQFVDSFDNSIFTDSFEGSGTATGPTVLGGVRVPVGQWSVGGEVRWQKAKGDLPTNMGFAGSTVDLGGWNYLATFQVRF